MQEFAAGISQARVNAFAAERVNSAYNNVVGKKRTRMGRIKAFQATAVYFNSRAASKAKRAKTSVDEFMPWYSSSSGPYSYVRSKISLAIAVCAFACFAWIELYINYWNIAGQSSSKQRVTSSRVTCDQ